MEQVQHSLRDKIKSTFFCQLKNPFNMLKSGNTSIDLLESSVGPMEDNLKLNFYMRFRKGIQMLPLFVCCSCFVLFLNCVVLFCVCVCMFCFVFCLFFSFVCWGVCLFICLLVCWWGVCLVFVCLFPPRLHSSSLTINCLYVDSSYM